MSQMSYLLGEHPAEWLVPNGFSISSPPPPSRVRRLCIHTYCCHVVVGVGAVQECRILPRNRCDWPIHREAYPALAPDKNVREEVGIVDSTKAIQGSFGR